MHMLHIFVGNDIPPIPSGAYDYDQLGQSTNEDKNTNKQQHYDVLMAGIASYGE